jgi:rhodanese-related sulfurtransferase
MFTHLLKSVLVAGLATLISAPVNAYDAGLAESYARLFEPVSGAKTGKHLHLMKVEDYVAKVRQGETLVGLDIRTPTESVIFTSALPGSLVIPMNELFRTENLDRLPTDQPIVVLCRSGTRATAVGTALRHVGFDNVFILKGGYKALSAYLGAKTANQPLGPQQASVVPTNR